MKMIELKKAIERMPDDIDVMFGFMDLNDVATGAERVLIAETEMTGETVMIVDAGKRSEAALISKFKEVKD